MPEQKQTTTQKTSLKPRKKQKTSNPEKKTKNQESNTNHGNQFEMFQ